MVGGYASRPCHQHRHPSHPATKSAAHIATDGTLILTTSIVTSTPYADDMLFFECRQGRYYAGQIGGSSRFETRLAGSRLAPRATAR
jgi:hypothetical protein